MEIVENGQVRSATGAEVADAAARAADEDANLLTRVAQQVKEEAQRRIFQVAPDWKQHSLTARGAELLRIRIENGGWTAAERAEADSLSAVWQRIKDIRANSDSIESTLADMTRAALRAFDATDDLHWAR